MWFDVIQFFSTGGLGVYVWLSNRKRVSVVASHEGRLSRIEDALSHAPNHSDIAGLYNRLDAVHGELREMAGKLDALVKTHAMVVEHLIEGRR